MRIFESSLKLEAKDKSNLDEDNEISVLMMGIKIKAKLTSMVPRGTASRKKILACLLSLGADFLLDGEDGYGKWGNSPILACTVAYFIIFNFRDIADVPSDVSDAVGLGRDLKEGGPIEVTKFFLKRVECPCLKVKYEQLKRTHPPPKGWCSHCNIWKTRTELMLCSACKVAQYCNPKCQQAHWRKHKELCEMTQDANGGNLLL